jgi:hypothetical protein
MFLFYLNYSQEYFNLIDFVLIGRLTMHQRVIVFVFNYVTNIDNYFSLTKPLGVTRFVICLVATGIQ